MATIKLVLDTRQNSQDKEGNFPLVLRLGHKSKTRDIGLDIHVTPDQFDPETHKITGIKNAVRKSNKCQKLVSEVALWLDDNKGEIKLWPIAKLKDKIEQTFLGKQTTLSVLAHGAKVLYRLRTSGQISTAASYEDALKILVKYRMKQAKQNDRVSIRTLFDRNEEDVLELKETYKDYDMPIKAFDAGYAEDFKAYLNTRFSRNTVNIHLRSLQVIFNNAERTIPELKGHKPFEGMKKGSSQNAPVVLSQEEVQKIRDISYPKTSSKFHVRHYFLFMFNNMGMNFYDIALAKVNQFDGVRFHYTRKKTEKEGDHFSIKQSEENIDILNHYIQNKPDTQYIFPILEEGMDGDQIFNRKRDKLKWFNNNIKKIATDLGIEKNLSSYTPRDTWTNLGLEMGIDIRKISSGLGHSSVQLTEKHYAQNLQEKLLDEINGMITAVGPDRNSL